MFIEKSKEGRTCPNEFHAAGGTGTTGATGLTGPTGLSGTTGVSSYSPPLPIACCPLERIGKVACAHMSFVLQEAREAQVPRD